MKTRVCFLVFLILVVSALWLMGCEKDQDSIVSPGIAGDVGEEQNVVGPGEKSYYSWWRNLGQGGRNQAILDRAHRDINRYVGLNCKNWVRKVVQDASKGVVYLPATRPDENGWYFAYSRYLVGMSGGIRNAQPGWIVQTNWRLNNGSITPHTFIVVGRSSYGINIIESNWCGTNKVCTRYISFSQFESQVIRYSCYYVTGG